MNGNDNSTQETPEPQRPPSSQREAQASLFERMRSLFVRSPASIRHDIEDALDEAASEADFTPQERTILKNVLGLHDVRVANVMVPRADIIATSIDIGLGDLLKQFRAAGHSRLPVYGDTLDDPRGMVHIRDFVDYLTSDIANESAEVQGERDPTSLVALVKVDLSKSLAATNILRPVLFAPPSMPALDLLVKMQTSRTHMALVIDEYGGTDGLVSIEDVVEAIVGDIEDEHDEIERPEILKGADDSYVAEARISLGDVTAATGADFSTIPGSEDVDTLGGLLIAKAGRVPGRGEIIGGIGEFEYEIIDADPRRIKRVKIHAIAKNASRLKGNAKRQLGE